MLEKCNFFFFIIICFIIFFFEKKNVNICVDANVSEILIENNKAVGVRLENGQTVRARTVLTNCTDHVTFKQLINKNTPVDEKFMSV